MSRTHSGVVFFRRVLVRTGVVCALVTSLDPAHGQEARWAQNFSIRQLLAQGNDGAALPIQEQAVQQPGARRMRMWGFRRIRWGILRLITGNYSGAGGRSSRRWRSIRRRWGQRTFRSLAWDGRSRRALRISRAVWPGRSAISRRASGLSEGVRTSGRARCRTRLQGIRCSSV